MYDAKDFSLGKQGRIPRCTRALAGAQTELVRNCERLGGTREGLHTGTATPTALSG